MKKTVTVIAALAALTLTAGLCACSKNTGKDKFDDFTSTEEVYGFSAASAGMIISSMNGSRDSAAAGGVNVVAENVSVDYDTSVLDGYMALVESLLSDGKFSITSPESDREGYTDKTVVSYPDMAGNVTQYVMYYNKTLSGIEEDKGETEENYSITGVMVIDGADYEIYGRTQIETEGGEVENETELRVKLGENSYMLVRHEVEKEHGEYEQEYGYSLYEGGTLVEKSTFSYETEKDETELKMTSEKNGVKEVFKFEKDSKNGKQRIRLKVGEGAAKASYIVTVNYGEDGSKTYTYTPAGK